MKESGQDSRHQKNQKGILVVQFEGSQEGGRKMAKPKKSSPYTDCEKELIMEGEDLTRAAEICKGKAQSESQTDGREPSQEAESFPYDD